MFVSSVTTNSQLYLVTRMGVLTLDLDTDSPDPKPMHPRLVTRVTVHPPLSRNRIGPPLHARSRTGGPSPTSKTDPQLPSPSLGLELALDAGRSQSFTQVTSPPQMVDPGEQQFSHPSPTQHRVRLARPVWPRSTPTIPSTFYKGGKQDKVRL